MLRVSKKQETVLTNVNLTGKLTVATIKATLLVLLIRSIFSDVHLGCGFL